MPRVASLYLPNLPIDRLRRIERRAARHDPRSSPAFAWSPSPELRSGEDLEIGTRIADCACPRGGGWRPGARWSQADIDALPAHQRPPMRELGRRTEAAPVAFNEVRKSNSPLVTIHRNGPRMEVAAASPAAQALGIVPGMAASQARAFVPGLDVRDAEPEMDAALLHRLGLFAARRWTPRAAVHGTDGLWLDLSGVAHLFGGEARMCARILRFCARLGLSARIAVAGTYGAAHAIARYGAEAVMLCANGEEGQAIASFPLAALRVEENVLAAARRLGIERVGDLIAMPRAPLQRRFGATLLARLDQALGRKGEAFDPIVPEEPPMAALRLLEPIATAEAIEQVLGDLMALLVRRLQEQGLGVRRAALHCLRVDGRVEAVAIGTARATRDGAHLAKLLCAMIEKIEPGFGIEEMRLVAGWVEPLAPQTIDGALAGEKPVPELAHLVDRIAGRIGPRRLFRTGAVESDVPERSVRRVPPLEQGADWPAWPRPVRLLSRPERVESVMSVLPDGPPKRFTWRGKPHDVRRADGPERVFGEWWRRTGEAEAVRDYFQVEDEEGARFWLYRKGDGFDPHTGDLSWWLQGTFA